MSNVHTGTVNEKRCLDCGQKITSRAIRCARCAQLGRRNASWKGGKRIVAGGYVAVHSPDHPYKDKQGYVLEHRLVMEAHLGRPLLPTEVVHHIDGDTRNNKVENLHLFSGQSAHASHHNHGSAT